MVAIVSCSGSFLYGSDKRRHASLLHAEEYVDVKSLLTMSVKRIQSPDPKRQPLKLYFAVTNQQHLMLSWAHNVAIHYRFVNDIR